jgi:DNA recombination protein RmuC
MALLIIGVLQLILMIAVLLVLLFRGTGWYDTLNRQLADVRIIVDRIEPSLRDEVRAFRIEINESTGRDRKAAGEDSRALREELLKTVNSFGDQVGDAITGSRRDQLSAADHLRESVQNTLVTLGGEFRESNKQLTSDVRDRLERVASEITQLTTTSDQKLETIRLHVDTRLADASTQQVDTGEQLRESIQANFSRLSSDLRETSQQLNEVVRQRLEEVSVRVTELSTANENSQESLRKTVEQNLNRLTESNSEKLEAVRATVDEKLHSTLEKRLTDSFGLVTDQLGSVQRGLGEMKDLATGVGDLKRVLTNIRSRGGYGEVQLAMLLDQMLSPEQYIKNANIRPGTQETVEFAIKFPGSVIGESVLLPIDAKFPQEAWEQLEDAQVRGHLEDLKEAGEKLAAAIRTAAKDISGKYIEPPITMDFAVLFLPTEGLFAEVVRRAGLVNEIQTKYRVTVAGPTTLAALLTSFQMGFRTLAIQKKGSEVWKLLAATKLEFEKFGGLMDRVDKNIGTVQNTLRDVGIRARVITRRLKDVEADGIGTENPGTLLEVANLETGNGEPAGISDIDEPNTERLF